MGHVKITLTCKGNADTFQANMEKCHGNNDTGKYNRNIIWASR